MRTMSRETRRRNYCRAWDRAAKAAGVPVGPDDWQTAEYSFTTGKPVEQASAAWVECRLQALATAPREPARIWRDDSGEIQFGTNEPPEPVRETMRAAFERGVRSGTITHWEPIRGTFNALCGYRPVLYVWQTL